MDVSQNGSSQMESLRMRRSLGQRLFARFGTIAILSGVLFVVAAWISFLGWILTGLLNHA